MPETLIVHDLTTGYAGRRGGAPITVTAPFSASLHSGELTCLLGPNGAGKSTLLRTLSGFQPPLSGDITIAGRSVAAYRPAELARVIGVVLTERISLDAMRVDDLVALGRAPYTGFWGRLSVADRRIVSRAFEMVGIEDLRERMVATLSDGERQKVMIAKALAQETPIIFLDEPTAFLDYPSKVDIMQLLRRLAREEGKTVFMSTHDLELAFQVADTIWLLSKELGVTTGTPEDLAIAGEPGRYFRRDGVVFDSRTGQFRIANRMTRRVFVDGHPQWRELVVKALSRNGFEAVDNPHGTASEIILTVDGTFRVDGREYHSIGAMLAGLLAQ